MTGKKPSGAFWVGYVRGKTTHMRKPFGKTVTKVASWGRPKVSKLGKPVSPIPQKAFGCVWCIKKEIAGCGKEECAGGRPGVSKEKREGQK